MIFEQRAFAVVVAVGRDQLGGAFRLFFSFLEKRKFEHTDDERFFFS